MHSFWAESIGGQLLSRVNHNHKNIGYSIMKDANERALVAGMRTLNPKLFPQQSKVSARYSELLKGNPAYLSSTPVIVLAESNVMHGEVTELEMELWATFLRQNFGYRGVLTRSDILFQNEIEWN